MSEPVLKCPRCSQEWQITGDGKVRCGSCGYVTDSFSGAAEYIEKNAGLKKPDGINANSKLPVHECPQCGSTAMVDMLRTGTDKDCQFLCFSCGGKWAEGELERCPECIQWKPGEEFQELIICRSAVGFYVCRSCYEKIFK